MSPTRQRGWRLAIKVAFDRSVGVAGLCVLSPVLAVTSLAIRLSMGAPVFFCQERPGRNGRLFRIVKFRTMRDARDHRGVPLPDGERLTRLGAFLRRTSIDELPQLWNVAKGDLSLVGPRPLLARYLERYTPEQARRHDVLPGITGFAQVNGRNALTWEEKFALDLWYVNHWSLGLDARILARTLWKVLAREGVANVDHATMPEFLGTSRGDDHRIGDPGPT